jgi:5-methylcytosine-specific restriction endonuclease McrA
MEIDGEPVVPPKKRKKTIPKSMRVAVWNTYVGEDIGRTKCGVCGVADMTQLNFHCAHVVAESKGGATTVANLRPTCAGCNLSMRTMHLDEYKQTYFG